MSYYEYPKYKKKKKIDPNQQIAKYAKKKIAIEPVIIEGRKIAKTWWGIAWIENLEDYSDYENRIPRGRSYVRSGSVIDLKISEGKINALVQGTKAKPYSVSITISKIDEKKWENLTKDAANKVESMEELIEGKFPTEMKELLTMHSSGLFPSPKEIAFDCSCPDWANMCKHVAATLYGVGAKLDDDPSLFFKLRQIDMDVLIKKSIDKNLDNLLKTPKSKTSRTMDDKDALDLFGLNINEEVD